MGTELRVRSTPKREPSSADSTLDVPQFVAGSTLTPFVCLKLCIGKGLRKSWSRSMHTHCSAIKTMHNFGNTAPYNYDHALTRDACTVYRGISADRRIISASSVCSSIPSRGSTGQVASTSAEQVDLLGHIRPATIIGHKAGPIAFNSLGPSRCASTSGARIVALANMTYSTTLHTLRRLLRCREA